MKKKNKIESLQFLANLVDNLECQIDEIVEMAFNITKESDKSGYTFDYIRNGMWGAESLLNILKKNDKASATK